MRHLFHSLSLLALVMAACTLTTVPPFDSPTEDAVQLTQTVQPLTATPSPTPTITPTPTRTATPPPTLVNCTPRFDWPVYIVVPGDTLSRIAQRVGSSSSLLAQANCLSNPNLITPGQPLRVPRLPDPDTQVGMIQVSPFLIAEGGSYTVSANTSITVSWPQARRDATRVEFYASPLIANPPSTLLGVDSYPADGASIPVTFPLNFQQAVHAIAYLGSGSRQLTANRIPVFAVDSGQNPPPTFQPNLGTEGDVTVLPAGSITTTWNPPVLTQATHVDFTLIRFGSQRQFLGRDSNMADGAQLTWAGGDAGPTGIHQFEVVAYRNSGILASRTVRIRFQTVPQVQGDVIINPILRTEGDVQIVEAGATVTLMWQNAPVGQSSQFEFTLYEDGIVGPRSIGIDTNGADGVSVPWTVPSALNNGRIVASARLPIQTGQTIESRPVRVRPETVNPQPGPVGQLTLSPIVREDSGWQVLKIGSTVTVTWVSAPIANVQSVDFYLTPTGTGMPLQLLGTDTNPADGASYTWTVTGGLSAHLSAIAFTADGREIVPTNDLLGVYTEE